MTEENGSVITGNPATDANPASKEQPWYGGFEDELRGYAENKGFKTPQDALKSYRELEKLMGADKAGRTVLLPKDESDVETMAALLKRLGHPEKADDYGIKAPEGLGDEFAKSAAEQFHKLGLTKKQARELSEWWNSRQKERMEAMQRDMSAASEKELADLKKEWGKAYNENVELARRAGKKFGIDEATFDAMEKSVGSRKLIELMHKIGSSIGEDKAAGIDGSTPSGAMTPSAARAKIDALKQDKAFVDKYLNKDASAMAEMQKLFKFANPG